MSGRWFRIAPDGQLHPVAHDVVLPGEHVERVPRLQRVELALRHGEGVVGEVDAAGVRVALVHREVDDPAELEAVRVDQPQLLAHPRARQAGQPRGSLLRACREHHAVVGAQPQPFGQRAHAVVAVILGDRPAPLAPSPRRIAQAGEALALRPAVQIVEELAALAGRPPASAPRAPTPPSATIEAKRPKPEPANRSPTSADLDRVAQVRLVVAVL